MTRITFDSLFAIMLAEWPVITNATWYDDDDAWAAQYFDPENEWGVFLQYFGHSVLVAAERDGLDKVESHHITEVNRDYIRERFEEELRYVLTAQVSHLTERNIELVNEYLRTGSASPSHDSTYKKRAWVAPPELAVEEVSTSEEGETRIRKPAREGQCELDKWRTLKEFADLTHRLDPTPSQAEAEFTAIVGTTALEHNENGSVWERDHTKQSGYIWKAWVEREDWEKHRDHWGVTADGDVEELEGMERFAETEEVE